MVEYEEKSGLLVPISKPPTLRLFVDDCNLRGGVLQAGVLVEEDWYLRQGIQEASRILRILGSSAKEFKASQLSSGNRPSYEEFLRLFVGAVGVVGMRGDACSIVTIDGSESFHPPQVDEITEMVSGVLAEYGVRPEANLMTEFSAQLMWLARHAEYLFRNAIKNPVKITFDEKHNYARLIRERVVVSKNGLGTAIWPRSRLLAGLLNTSAIRGMLKLSEIAEVDFKWSHTEFGLQAADLFANLFHGALRCVAGAKDPASVLRGAVLQTVVPELAPEEKLVMALGWDKEKRELVCRDTELASRCQLEPSWG